VTGYECKECGEPVAVLTENGNTVIVRACACDAPIVAVMDAGLEGSSSAGVR
jgi:predicted nucleic acid-binding Zn ribbon protein